METGTTATPVAAPGFNLGQALVTGVISAVAIFGAGLGLHHVTRGGKVNAGDEDDAIDVFVASAARQGGSRDKQIEFAKNAIFRAGILAPSDKELDALIAGCKSERKKRGTKGKND